MTEYESCPNCNSDLRGQQIPEEYLRAGHYGEWDGVTPQFYSRKIGIEVQGVYDGVLYWQCPDCGHKWHRWPELHTLRARAESYMS